MSAIADGFYNMNRKRERLVGLGSRTSPQLLCSFTWVYSICLVEQTIHFCESLKGLMEK